LHVVVEGLAGLLRVANELDTATQHAVTGLREGYADSDTPGSTSPPDSAPPAKPPNSSGTKNPARRRSPSSMCHAAS
jgi:hypothetical protein